MRTPEEIKNGLKCCPGMHPCNPCSYFRDEKCYDKVMDDALAYIRQLEERIDLMLIQMRGDCGTCAHKLTGAVVCAQCLQGDGRPNWTYEGLPEVETHG